MLFLLGGVPALDTAFAIFRRSISHGSPFTPDRGHLHHRLIDLGFSTPTTVFVLTSVHGVILLTGLLFLVRY
jgi:UDP-GlcNAc:undecaprenyl-phosphate GlcNAc-1-phosphate transferase